MVSVGGLPCRQSLFVYVSTLVKRLKNNGQQRTSETYAAMLKSFMRFRHGHDIEIDSLDAITVEDYQAYLFGCGLVANTVSFYMRLLRAAYYRALEESGMLRREIFKHVYTGVGQTPKRALKLCMIRRIKDVDLSGRPELEYARDMFMFSFYTRGMSFVDMAYLLKSDLSSGVLHYRRRKTGQWLHIRWERYMQEIVDKYHVGNSPYMLPIVRPSSTSLRSQYRGQQTKINKALKAVARLVGMDSNLTTYVARHSWASIARTKNIPISVISEGMGHESERVTRIYLASLDSAVIDKANHTILTSL